MTLPIDLEPAIRDPKKLRRTAFILVGMMVLGGVLILRGYGKWSREQAKDLTPAKIHQIRKERDLRAVRQDQQIVNLFDLRGKVCVVNAVTLTPSPQSIQSHRVMQRLAATYGAREDFKLISLVLDAPADPSALVPQMQQHAKEHGMDGKQWWLLANEQKVMHTFVKNELKTDTYPHTLEGKWVYDSSLVLIDRDGRVRRAVVAQKRGGQPFVATFDFEKAARWDANQVKTGTDLNNEMQLELLLKETIDRILVEPRPVDDSSFYEVIKASFRSMIKPSQP
jgi:cytochrome oxidase Cu insertion factor (SCO1/SenC/PrrC family)